MLLGELAELASPVVSVELAIEQVADAVEDSVNRRDRELAGAAANRQRDKLREVMLALDKLNHGDYGTCEACDEEISKARLDAKPWARLCLVCQEQEEEENDD